MSAKREFGKRIEAMLRDRGLTVAEVARLIDVPKSSVHNWLTGRASTNLDALGRLADLLGTDLDFLLLGVERAPQQITLTAQDLEEGYVLRIVKEKLRDP